MGMSFTEWKTKIIKTISKNIPKNKIFGWNFAFKNGEVKQVLAFITHDSEGDSQTYKDYLTELKTESIFYNGLSENHVVLDEYYNEGILNA